MRFQYTAGRFSVTGGFFYGKAEIRLPASGEDQNFPIGV
jgi:hypothetical protein